jgi:hypothetical protein
MSGHQQAPGCGHQLSVGAASEGHQRGDVPQQLCLAAWAAHIFPTQMALLYVAGGVYDCDRPFNTPRHWVFQCLDCLPTVVQF